MQKNVSKIHFSVFFYKTPSPSILSRALQSKINMNHVITAWYHVSKKALLPYWKSTKGRAKKNENRLGEACLNNLDKFEVNALYLRWINNLLVASPLHNYTCSGFSLINSNKVPPLWSRRRSLALLNARVQHCTRYFPAKTFCIPRGIIPQNCSSLGFAVLEELGNKQTNLLIHWLPIALKDRLSLQALN